MTNPTLNKKFLVNFGLRTPEITQLMFTHSNQLFWSAGHVTAIRGFSPPPFEPIPQSNLGHRVDSCWVLPQIFSFFSLPQISSLYYEIVQ